MLIPEGHIALGKLAQALIHGAKVIQIKGNFDQALTVVREMAARDAITLVNSVNPYRLEGQKTAAFEIVDELGDAPDVHCIPVGNAGNITAYWRGYSEDHAAGRAAKRPRMLGWQAAGAAPLVSGEPVPFPETIATAIRIGNPASWAGRDRRPRRVRRRHRSGDRRRDPRRLPAPGRTGRRVLRTGLGGVGGRPVPGRRRRPDPHAAKRWSAP